MTQNEWAVYHRAEVIVHQLGDKLREFKRYGRPRRYWRNRFQDLLWKLFA